MSMRTRGQKKKRGQARPSPGREPKSPEEPIAERDEFKDKYLRGLAEMDNFRKRIKKEKEDFQKYVLRSSCLTCCRSMTIWKGR